MKTGLLTLTIGVIFIVGFILGIITNELNNETRISEEVDDHDHATNLPHAHHHMEHEELEVTWEPIPTIEIEVLEDTKAGYNLHIKTTNFNFSPENANQDHIEGEGHAHLYIDDAKITRLYSNWFHIPELAPGEHTIMVTLNSNTHEDLTIDGEVIQSMTKVVVNE